MRTRQPSFSVLLLPIFFAENPSALTVASLFKRPSLLSLSSKKQDTTEPTRDVHRFSFLRRAANTPQSPALRRTSIKMASETDSNDSLVSVSSIKHRLASLRTFASKNFFLIGMFVAVGLARAFPSLGRNGSVLRPELMGKFGVTLIFLLSGLSLQLSQLTQAASNHKLNLLIQLMTFVAWPFLIGEPLTRFLATCFPTALFPQALLDGILIMTCLPTTVNMCVILTSTANGNVAAALFNAVVSNLAGIFVTPALLLYFFGSHIQLPFWNMLRKLSNKVLLPVAVGQALRFTHVTDFYEKHSKAFKRIQEVILLSILWNAFCTAFSESLGLEWKHGLALVALLPTVHAVAFAALFGLFSQPWLKFTRGDVVAACFCASQKTLAFGLPLINTIFEGNANLAAYCAPIMFIHPLQLIIGSLLVPRLEVYTSAADDNGASVATSADDASVR